MIDDYKNDIRKLFFISVDNSISEWFIEDNVYKFSLNSYKSSYECLTINQEKKQLVLNSYVGSKFKNIVICKYKGSIFTKDKQVYKYVKILKNHFKQMAENEKNKEKIEILESGYDLLMKKYKQEYEKEIRKDKLTKLDNN